MAEGVPFRARANAWVYTYRLELSLFVFALILRLFLIGITPPHELYSYWIGSDGKDFVNIGKNLAEGNGFSRAFEPPFIPDASRTPLYPLALAQTYLLFGSFIPIIFFEAVLSSLLPVLFVRMASLFVRNRRILFSGGLFVAVDLHLLVNTTFFASESLSIILLTLAFFELLRFSRAPDTASMLRSGFFLGLATLARPITYYAPLFLAPLFLYQGYRTGALSKMAKYFALFTTVFVLILSPWVARNLALFGDPGMNTNGWFNMYTRLAVTVVAIETKSDFYTTFYKMLDELSLRGYVSHPPPVTELEVRDPRFADIFKQETLRVIKEHPRSFMIFLVTSVFAVLTQDNTLGYASSFVSFNYDRPAFSPTLYASQYGVVALIKEVAPYLLGPYVVPYLMRAVFSALFILACLGAWILWRRGERFPALLLLGFIGYVVLFSVNAGGQITGRYRAQFLIVELVLAGVALEKWVARLKPRLL